MAEESRSQPLWLIGWPGLFLMLFVVMPVGFAGWCWIAHAALHLPWLPAIRAFALIWILSLPIGLSFFERPRRWIRSSQGKPWFYAWFGIGYFLPMLLVLEWLGVAAGLMPVEAEAPVAALTMICTIGGVWLSYRFWGRRSMAREGCDKLENG